MLTLKKILKKRFLAKTKKLNDCWLWQGALTGDGRGTFYFDGKQHTAHRAAYLLWKGSIPANKQVNHTCDVPYCVNPQHLYAGTQTDNMHDCTARKRRPNQYGERNPNAKLTPVEVAKIRKAYTSGEWKLKELSRVHGIHTSHVWRIVAKTRWNVEENA